MFVQQGWIAQGRRQCAQRPSVDARLRGAEFGFCGTGSDAADIFSLTSTTFEDGKLMPKKVANSKANQPNNPNCVGDNVRRSFPGAIRPMAPKALC